VTLQEVRTELEACSRERDQLEHDLLDAHAVADDAVAQSDFLKAEHVSAGNKCDFLAGELEYLGSQLEEVMILSISI
jgi:hypothetical protein